MSKVLGGILFGVGAIIALLSGLCSLLLLFEPNSDWEGVQIILIVGGIPFLVGVGIAIGGWVLMRTEIRPPPR